MGAARMRADAANFLRSAPSRSAHRCRYRALLVGAPLSATLKCLPDVSSFELSPVALDIDVLKLRRKSAQCVSDLRIDRLLARELSHLEEQSVRSHFAVCDVCAARANQLELDQLLPSP